jgi:hypothetical protein
MPSAAELLLQDMERYFATHPEGEHYVSQGQQLGVFLKRFQQLKRGEQYALFKKLLEEDCPVCDQMAFLTLCLTLTEVQFLQENTQALLLAFYRDNAQAPRARTVRTAMRELTLHAPVPVPLG